jgi:glycosyltransferase involved in cell wall biosynthesis
MVSWHERVSEVCAMSYKGKKVVVVMPAYNAAKTLRKTYDEVIAQEFVDLVIIVDDASSDETAAVAEGLTRARVHTHDSNLGYGANQKTCYRLALKEGADIVIMLHPDYQYTPKLIPAMVSVIGSGLYPCVLGSRILGGHALEQGMPVWRYIANRFLTFVENVLMGTKLSEFHTGYRAFSRELLEHLPWDRNSDDFLFDNQILAQVLWYGYPIAEITCPTRYQPESSSIDFHRSVEYGWGCLLTAATFSLARLGLVESELFPRPVD